MPNHPALPAALEAAEDEDLPLSPTLLRELRRALRTIRFGAVELVIHEGQVVQLERREKVRFGTEVTRHHR